jgi:hypothetical protein
MIFASLNLLLYFTALGSYHMEFFIPCSQILADHVHITATHTAQIFMVAWLIPSPNQLFFFCYKFSEEVGQVLSCTYFFLLLT